MIDINDYYNNYKNYYNNFGYHPRCVNKVLGN